MHNSRIYFDKVLYMFRTELLSIRSLNTIYTAIGICHASSIDCLIARSGYITMHVPLNVKIVINNNKSMYYRK